MAPERGPLASEPPCSIRPVSVRREPLGGSGGLVLWWNEIRFLAFPQPEKLQRPKQVINLRRVSGKV